MLIPSFRTSIITIFTLVAPLLPFTGYATNGSEFERWRNQELQSFQDFKDKRDKEFTDYLKKQWEEMQVFAGRVRDETPKPVVIPKAKPKPTVKVPEGEIVEIKPTLPSAPPPIAPAPRPLPGKLLKVEYLGHTINLNYDAPFKKRLGRTVNEEAISGLWTVYGQADYNPLLEQLQAHRQRLQLNDWGFVQLVTATGQTLHPRDANTRALFICFFLVKTGYNTRMAYANNQLYLLLPSRQMVYAVPYFTLDNERFFALRLDDRPPPRGKVYTYKEHYRDARTPLDLRMASPLRTAPRTKSRTLTFEANGKQYAIEIKYDQRVIEFFDTYPQLDINYYFMAAVEPDVATQFAEQLQPILAGQTEEQAINTLLRLTQTAFAYKTDDEQFGRERYLHLEETLGYPYSDCEDRSVFFAWLVRNFLGLDVVGIRYPGHLATAVRFTGNVNGDAVIVNGQRYVVADPTYINANAGMVMPQFEGEEPEVIVIQEI